MQTETVSARSPIPPRCHPMQYTGVDSWFERLVGPSFEMDGGAVLTGADLHVIDAAAISYRPTVDDVVVQTRCTGSGVVREAHRVVADDLELGEVEGLVVGVYTPTEVHTGRPRSATGPHI